MEMDIKSALAEKLSDYFNVILKNSLKYKDIFKLTHASGDRTILFDLINDNKSDLIALMESSSSTLCSNETNVTIDLKNKIEKNIELGLSNFGDVNIKIIILTDIEFVLQY